MTPILFLLVSFLALVTIRVPIAFALGLSSIATVLMLGLPLVSVVNQMQSNINSFALLAVPFFLFLGRLMNDSGITTRLLRLADALVGHIRGGLGHINVVVSMMFASLSGSAAADTASVGGILIPAMKQAGYPAPFSVALTAASSTLGVIIPPSIMMVIYGAFGNVSIAALFLSGILPGLLIGAIQMGYTYTVSLRFSVEDLQRKSCKEVHQAFLASAPPLVLPLIILGGITGGIFTATEAAAIAVVIGLILATLIYRTVPFSAFPQMLRDTVVSYSLPLFAVAAAGIMGWLISYLGVARLVANGIIGFSDVPTVILLLMMAFMLVIGTVLSPITAIIIFMPIIQEIAIAADINQVHMALVVCLSLALGLVTPPYGICLLIAAQIGEVSMPRAFMAILPIVALTILMIITVIVVPGPYLFLARTFVPNVFVGG
ncbi:MAG: TRAP transporter large permease [Acuticoccus sp.]